MKKFVTLLFLLSALVYGGDKASALTYEEGLEQTKPMALLIYADWADDYNDMLQAFDKMEGKNNKFNFIRMNIADKSTKAFNKSFHIYPGLPYVLLFKDRGKISRYLKKDCVLNESCFNERLKLFSN
ncbi:thioredoxin family protein [bacterium]|nr:thioredoxin family protein [bacterium]